MRSLLAFLLLAGTLWAAECQALFPGVLSSESEIRFDAHAQVEQSGGALTAPLLTQSRPPVLCGKKPCVASRTAPAAFALPPFLPHETQTVLTITDDAVFSDATVENLKITGEGATVRFVAPEGSGLFTNVQRLGHIEVAAEDVTLIFAAGDYQMKSLKVQTGKPDCKRAKAKFRRGDWDRFTLKPEGPVRLFVAEDVRFSDGGRFDPPGKGRDIRINPRGKPAQLQLIAGGDLTVDAPMGYEMAALVYAAGEISFTGNRESRFSGAARSGGMLKITDRIKGPMGGSQGTFRFDQRAVQSLYRNGDPAQFCMLRPEDPGAAGKTTLLGIDANRNGVRDDVELYLLEKYEDDPLLLALGMQTAAETQKTLIVYNDKTLSREHARSDTSFECGLMVWDRKHGTHSVDTPEGQRNYFTEEAYEHQLRDRILNTEERLKAHWRYNSQLGGMNFPSKKPVKTDCRFDPDMLEAQQ